MTDMIDIRGSGGGGKKGGGSARTPVEHPDSLHNTSYAVILDAIANGEVYGPAGDTLLSSIYLNGTPIQNPNGDLNFKNVVAHWRPGNQAQDHIPGFPSSSNIVAVGSELQYGQSWVQRLTNPSLDAVRVSIHTPQLVKTIDSGNKAGDRVGHRVNYAIDLSTDNGAFVTVVNSSFNGKTVNGYTRTHRIELPAGTEWTIRVRRLTENSTNSMVADKLMVQSYAEVVDGKFRYPMTSLVGIKIDAEQFKQVPTRAYHWKGLIIRVPSNYNPETRTYSGTWDGSFKRAYSNNPAWVYYDILTSPLYGLGENVTANMIDRYALYQIAAYCDQMVSDGQGGTEPRFTCNAYIQSKADALRVLNDLASVFRGVSYYANNQVIAVADRPSDPVYTFSNAKVVNGRFEYTGSDISTIKTVALVSYNDPDDFYRAKVEVVNDDDGIRRYGIRKTELVAFGCTSRAQAQRVGLYHLYTSRMETGGVSFSVGLDGFIPQPGDLVRIADNDLAGRQIGGMVKSGTRTVLTLDRDVAAKVGDKISVNIAGKNEQRTISAISGRDVTVSVAFSRAPKTSAYAIDATDLVSRLIRIISIKENDDLTFSISGVLHHPSKFNAIDHGVRLEPLPVSVVPARSQNAPTNIVINSYNTIRQGRSNANLEITWNKAQGAVKYDVQYKRDNSEWIQLPVTGQSTVTLDNVYTGEYVARVRAINQLDVPSLWAYSAMADVTGLLANPQPLVSLTTQSQIYGILVSWVYPTGANIIERVELMRSDNSNFANAILHGEYSYPTTSTLVPALAAQDMWFWGRTVDKNGIKSAWYPVGAGVHGEASADVNAYMDVFKDEFVSSVVGQQMMTEIESLDTRLDGVGDGLASEVVELIKGNLTGDEDGWYAGDDGKDFVGSVSYTSVVNEGVLKSIEHVEAMGVRLNQDINAAIMAESTVRAQEDSALASQINKVASQASANASAIQSETTARTNADSALASQINKVASQASAN
uniref:host specificity protein J n=1 Tax=Oligella urethralis TaxID=90245 RepID=UPI00242FBABF